MSRVAEYFAATRYQGQWYIGDRVQGTWNKIPFRGTVGNDTVINERQGPRVSVHLDLPIQFDNVVYNFIFVKPEDLKIFK